MKKTISILSVILLATTMFAQTPAIRARIAMNGQNLTVREDASYADPTTKNEATSTNPNGTNGIMIFDQAATKYYTQFAATDLTDAKVAFTPTATSVTFNFSVVLGTLYLYDIQEDVYTLIENSGSYAFTVDAAKVGTLVADRFVLKHAIPAVPTEYAICYRNGILEIANNEASDMSVVITDMDDNAVTGSPLTAVAETFNELALPAACAAGQQYKVKVGTKDALVIRVKATVTTL